MMYFVYIFFDSRKTGVFSYGDLVFNQEPIYVGKSHMSSYREAAHLRECRENAVVTNRIKVGKFKKIIAETGDNPPCAIYKDNLSEQDALELEKILIRKIGRISIETGPLTNLTDGGDGLSGYKHSQKTKELISKYSSGRKHSLSTKQKISSSQTGESNSCFKHGKYCGVQSSGLSRSESKMGMRNPMWNKEFSETHKQRISENNARSKLWIVERPDGEELAVCSLRKFCEANGLHYRSMRRVATGERKQHRGHKCKAI